MLKRRGRGERKEGSDLMLIFYLLNDFTLSKVFSLGKPKTKIVL